MQLDCYDAIFIDLVIKARLIHLVPGKSVRYVLGIKAIIWSYVASPTSYVMIPMSPLILDPIDAKKLQLLYTNLNLSSPLYTQLSRTQFRNKTPHSTAGPKISKM